MLSLPTVATLDSSAAAITKRSLGPPWKVWPAARAGVDVINEGEYTKGGNWLSYLDQRLAASRVRPDQDGATLMAGGRDREEFAEFYRYAREKGTLYLPSGQDPGASSAVDVHGPDHLPRSGRAEAEVP